MRVRFTGRAHADIDAILRYMASENPQAAARLVGSIEALIENLSSHLLVGHATRPHGRYVLTVPRVPYKVFYRVAGDEVRILRIRHTSRRPLGTIR